MNFPRDTATNAWKRFVKHTCHAYRDGPLINTREYVANMTKTATVSGSTPSIYIRAITFNLPTQFGRLLEPVHITGHDLQLQTCLLGRQHCNPARICREKSQSILIDPQVVLPSFFIQTLAFSCRNVRRKYSMIPSRKLRRPPCFIPSCIPYDVIPY